MPLNEYEFPKAKVANVQSQLERLVEKNYYLHQSARDAYRSYILAYNSHQLKDIFNVHSLDLQVGAVSKLRSGRWRVWPRGDRKWPVGMCGGYDDDIIRPAQRKPGLGLFQRCPGYYDREQNFPSLHVPCGGQRVGSGVYAAWSLWTVRILSVTCFNEARR